MDVGFGDDIIQLSVLFRARDLCTHNLVNFPGSFRVVFFFHDEDYVHMLKNIEFHLGSH